MRNKMRRCIFFAVLCMLCIFPYKVKAEETEYNFNTIGSVTIADVDSHAFSGKYTWLKYKAKANGYLTVKMSKPESAASDAKGYLALYNGRKMTPLSSKSIFYNTQHGNRSYWYEISFGLRKGQEYYIRVMGENAVKISRTFTKVKDQSGASKTKAAGLKKNKFKKGLIYADTKSAGWYKLKLTKSQKLRLYYHAKTRGVFKISIYYGKQMIYSRNISNTESQRKITLYLHKSDKPGKKCGMIPGVYYLKVESADSASSGFYKLKWK